MHAQTTTSLRNIAQIVSLLVFSVNHPNISFLRYDANTVWPEILAGRYFGGLLKICHLAEFTLAVEPGLAIMIFITKWLLKRAGILIGP